MSCVGSTNLKTNVRQENIVTGCHFPVPSSTVSGLLDGPKVSIGERTDIWVLGDQSTTDRPSRNGMMNLNAL